VFAKRNISLLCTATSPNNGNDNENRPEVMSQAHLRILSLFTLVSRKHWSFGCSAEEQTHSAKMVGKCSLTVCAEYEARPLKQPTVSLCLSQDKPVRFVTKEKLKDTTKIVEVRQALCVVDK
jgi:hypothetical protein